MLFVVYIFFFKQKTAYEMRISDWSSDVCSSDLIGLVEIGGEERANGHDGRKAQQVRTRKGEDMAEFELIADGLRFPEAPVVMDDDSVIVVEIEAKRITRRSEEHTSELQSLMRISYAVFCLKKKNNYTTKCHRTRTATPTY